MILALSTISNLRPKKTTTTTAKRPINTWFCGDMGTASSLDQVKQKHEKTGKKKKRKMDDKQQ